MIDELKWPDFLPRRTKTQNVWVNWLVNNTTFSVWNLIWAKESNDSNSLVTHFQKLENSLEWELKWKKIKDFDNIGFLQNWNMVWRIMIWDRWYPFNWDNIISEIWWKTIIDCENVFIRSNWDLAWKIWIWNSWYIFSWDKLITEVWWVRPKAWKKAYYDCSFIHSQPNWDLAWFIKVSHKNVLHFMDNKITNHLFYGDNLISEFLWKPIEDAHYVHTNSKWILSWRVTIWWIWYPFVWKEAITEIWWVKIKSCYYIHSNPITWEISWQITSIDDKKYLFVWDRLIRTIWWKEVTRFINIHTQPNWTLAWGMVAKEGLIKNYLSDGIKKTYLFVWDTLIDTIWEPIIEHIIEDCYCIHTQPNWALAWRVTIWGKKVPFIWNKIIHSIWWEEVEFCEELSTLPDWTLTWMIKVKWVMLRFVWDIILR